MDKGEKSFTAAARNAGPAPKLTRSATVSKYFPKLLATPSFLATAPSEIYTILRRLSPLLELPVPKSIVSSPQESTWPLRPSQRKAV